MTTLETERSMLLHGLLAAMRFSRQPMVITDPNQPDNPIIAANDSFRQLTQYPDSELVGRNCRFLQGPATDPEAVRQLGRAVRSGDGFVQCLANYRRDGTLFWNLLFISPVMGHDGHLHFFFANQHDVSSSPPPNLPEVPIGPAHMSPGQQTEFRLLLLDLVQDVTDAAESDGLAVRVRAIEGAINTAREIAALSTRLTPGFGP